MLTKYSVELFTFHSRKNKHLRHFIMLIQGKSRYLIDLATVYIYLDFFSCLLSIFQFWESCQRRERSVQKYTMAKTTKAIPWFLESGSIKPKGTSCTKYVAEPWKFSWNLPWKTENECLRNC